MEKGINRSIVVRTLIADAATLISVAVVFAVFPGHTAKLITDIYPPVLAALCTWFSFRIYRSLEKGRQARRIWALITAAMGFWTLAEITWALYDFAQAEPYPSWADLFYLIGNALLIAFFAVQVRFLRLVLQGWKRFLAIGLILLFITVAGIFTYAPMFMEPPGDWLEFVVNILYDTGYLLLLIGATVLTLAIYEGILGRRWAILAAGMWLYALSNQIFFYANWYGLYYPNDEATPLSVSFDLLYIASYLVILSGLYLRWALPFPTVRLEDVLASAPKLRPQETWVLLSDEGGRTSFVDSRLLRTLRATDIGQFTGEFVGTVLGLRTDLDWEMLGEVRTRGYSQPRKVLLAGQLYALQAVAEEGPLPRDVYWLLTPWGSHRDIRPEERASLETLLAQAVRGTARTTGDLGQAYCQAVFQLLSLMCARSGGQEVGQQFTHQFGPGVNVCLEELSSDLHAGAGTCRSLLHQALEYTLMVAPADQVRSALERLEMGLGEEILQAADAAGLRLPLPAG